MIDLFEDLGLAFENLHPKFRQLKSMMLDGERKILESWTEGFVDRDNKFVKEFQISFHSAFWELYLHRLFMEQRCSINYSYNSPDFVITAPFKLYVEAVTANIKQGGRVESTRNYYDILENLTPPHLQVDFIEQMNESIVRYSNAIHSKLKKMQDEYSTLSWVDTDAPFVIAIGSYSQVNYGKEYYYSMFALLYGLFFDPKQRKFNRREEIIKPGTNSPIKVSLFDESAMQDISAIIFSCTMTLGKLTSLSKSINDSPLNMHTVLIVREEPEQPYFRLQDVSEESPELHSDGLYIFHNPNAKVKLSMDAFAQSCALQIELDQDGIFQFLGTREPMVSRTNIPNLFFTPGLKEQLIEETFDLFNRL